MSRCLSLGLVGAGDWGNKIISTIAEISDVRIAHLACRTERSNSDIPDNCQFTTDWHTVISNDELDGVIVASPAGLHTEMAVAAIERGLPVYVEKPSSINMKEATHLHSVASRHQGIVHVGYIDISNPAWQGLKKSLSLLGDIKHIDSVFGGPGPIREDISPLWDWGPHPLALIISILGEPDGVDALQLSKRRVEPGTAEKLQMSLDFAGVKAIVHIANDLPEKSRRLSIKADNGNFLYDDLAVEKASYEKHGEPRRSLEYTQKPPLVCALKRFLSAIRHKKEDYQDVKLSMSVTAALSEAESILKRTAI